jgi:AraC-like DNA-binding protein
MSGEAIVRFWQPSLDVPAELVCAYLEASEGPLHLHEEWQFGVPESPSKLSLGAFRRHSAGAGDVTIVAPYTVHNERGVTGEASRWRMLYVASSMVTRLYGARALRFRGPVVTDAPAAAELRELMRQSAEGSIGDAECLTLVSGWLTQFLLRHGDGGTPPRAKRAVERTLVYLQNRPTQPVTSREVEAVAGVSLSYLQRSFYRAVGLPPGNYHAQVRLARARRLLAEGKSATWVAHECGFADQSHLTRRFKECHGLTPGAFQAQYRDQRGAGDCSCTSIDCGSAPPVAPTNARETASRSGYRSNERGDQ